MIGPDLFFDSFINAFYMLSTQLYWLFALVLVVSIMRSVWFKGVLGEWAVNLTIKLNFKQPNYYLFKDVLLPTDTGTTQIDHVLLSRFGIFVIETKNMKGWIFGKENQAKWTQQIYKHKSQFQNPIHQNLKHKRALERVLDVDSARVESVIVFVGEAKFKTQMPRNVIYRSGLSRYIRAYSEECFTEAEFNNLISLLSDEKLISNFNNKRKHVEHVKTLRSSPKLNNHKKLFDKTNTNASKLIGEARLCPKCGNNLVLRTAKRGDNKGNEFYGCSTFPKCRYTQA